MLTVACVHDPAARYYLADLHREPGLPGAWAHGRWLSGPDALWNLAGPVRPEALQALLAREHPHTGRRIVISRPSSVVGYDLVFSAPKSVSALFALGDAERREALAEAHRGAVAAAMGYVGTHAAGGRRREAGDRPVVPVRLPAAAAFDHVASRTLDPHLHTHVVVANLGHGLDSRWSALDGRGLFRHAAAAGALYDAELRQRLGASLGVHWARRPAGGLDVEGVPLELLGAFSGRSAAIREHRAEHSVRTARGDHVAWAATRPAKQLGVSVEALDARWHQVAADVGVGPELVIGVTGQMGQVTTVLDERRFAWAVGHTGRETLARRDVVEAWAAALPGGLAAEGVDRAVEHWAPTGALGAAEAWLAPAGVVPARRVLEDLGPRPAGDRHQALWRAAAARLEDYRARWPGTVSPLIEDRAALQRMPARQLAEHLQLRREVRSVQQALGRRLQPRERRSLVRGRG